tara:strand:+ start:365 stop:571 length:207 start_codon:yes stop_codon:yes gene_type:complete
MENRVQRKKNIEILEDIQQALKGLLNETDQLKRDVRYIKTYIQMKEKVKQDLEQQKHEEPISVGWRLW